MTYGMTKPLIFADLLIYAIGFLVILLGVFILVMLVSSRNYTLSVAEDRLLIRSLFYNTDLKLNDIDIENIKLVDLHNSDIKIQNRLNGVGLPGLLVGWFSSSVGKLKLYISDKSHVLFIPTKLDYQILFSTEQGDEVIQTIKGK